MDTGLLPSVLVAGGCQGCLLFLRQQVQAYLLYLRWLLTLQLLKYQHYHLIGPLSVLAALMDMSLFPPAPVVEDVRLPPVPEVAGRSVPPVPAVTAKPPVAGVALGCAPCSLDPLLAEVFCV
ncbi:hypothetical protein MTO96_012347 [Rhipicephalus appendiculatus]